MKNSQKEPEKGDARKMLWLGLVVVCLAVGLARGESAAERAARESAEKMERANLDDTVRRLAETVA